MIPEFKNPPTIANTYFNLHSASAEKVTEQPLNRNRKGNSSGKSTQKLYLTKRYCAKI